MYLSEHVQFISTVDFSGQKSNMRTWMHGNNVQIKTNEWLVYAYTYNISCVGNGLSLSLSVGLHRFQTSHAQQYIETQSYEHLLAPNPPPTTITLVWFFRACLASPSTWQSCMVRNYECHVYWKAQCVPSTSTRVIFCISYFFQSWGGVWCWLVVWDPEILINIYVYILYI